MKSKSHFIKPLFLLGLLILIYCNKLWAQNETSREIQVKKVTLLYHVDKQTADADLADMEQFTRRLMSNFPVVANIKIIKWKSNDAFFRKTEKEILGNMNLNGYYQLNFTQQSNEISSVKPTLVVRNSNNVGSSRSIALPVYSSDYYRSFDFSKFLNNELSGFLNSYFNINQGNYKAFTHASDKAGTLIPLAESASSGGDYERSNFFLNLLIGKNPSLPDKEKVKAFNRLGNNKINQYRIDEAEEEFNKALAIEPGNYGATLGIAKVRIEQNRWADALMKAGSLTPPTMEVYLLKGQAFMGLNQYDDAERNFRNINNSNPELYRKKLLYLGTIYLETDQTNNAYDIYKELYLKDTNDINIAYLYGYLIGLKGINEYKDKHYESAMELLTEANKVYSNTDVTDYLRLTYINERRFDDALQLIDKKIQQGEYSRDNIYLTHALDIREIFIDTARTDNAHIEEYGNQVLRAIELHLKSNPNDPDGYFYKGNTLTRMGRGTEGLAQMEIAYDKNKQDRSVQLDLMELYILNDKPAECEKFYNKVMQNYKNNKLKVRDRDLALMNYLLITSLKLQDKKHKKPQRKLNKLFKKGVIVDRWSYGSYLNWLEKSNSSEATKTFLVDLTNQMKAHNKPG